MQYTQDAVHGPSAGGSGQDNSYRFDGVTEPAGSRRSPSHWQLDLSYAQPFRLPAGMEAKLRLDLLDRQTGYNANPYARDATLGEARNHFDSLRVQVTVVH